MNSYSTEPSEFDQIFDKATKLANSGKYYEAISLLRRAITMKDSRGEAFLVLGQIYDNLGQKEEAILTYKKGIKAHPNFADNYFDLAMTYAQQIPVIRKNIFDYPIFHLAVTIERAHEFFLKAACLGDSEARKILTQEGIKANTKQDSILELIRIANNQMERKNLGNAKSIFSFIELIDPTKNNLFENAIAKLSEEEKETQYYKYLSNVKLLAGNSGHTKKEFDSIQMAIQLLPNKMDAYENLGMCYEDVGDKIKALEAYNKALELAPDDIAADGVRKIIKRLYPQDSNLGLSKKNSEDWI